MDDTSDIPNIPDIPDIRVYLVAEDPLARGGLAALLDSTPRCTIVGQSSPDDLPPDLDALHLDVLLWDLGWDAGTLFPALPAVCVELAEEGYPLVALIPADSETLTGALWASGLRGVLPRSVAAAALVAALDAVTHGLAVFDPTRSGAPLTARDLAPPGEALTPRELEVLALVAEGLANRAIAQHLAISDHTVKFHLNAILGKLNAQSRTAAVVQAIRRGLLTL